VIRQGFAVVQAPLANVAPSVTDVDTPLTMLDGVAVKDEIVGADTAVTVSVAVAVTPAESVTSKVSGAVAGSNDVSTVTFAIVAESEVNVTVEVPPVIWHVCEAQLVPLSEKLTGTAVVLPLAVTVAAGVVKLLITGAALTATDWVFTVPAALVMRSV
jgi:hypothetical protein